MTPAQAEKIVAADTRVREAARDVVDGFYNKFYFNESMMLDACVARLALALAEFDRAMEDSK